ncbi:GNAT family N-acetyltransferase [Nonomuraea zeae]|uniref:GNAT family N-acetyltransferase n=1 Tax=Nonomuraea zeae TaxID=1642303 RepID=A0A5S4GXI2_9ACTN|nr:GNAT family protein [Nonomuraea zeae]TMR37211.1 GNAT family N-acetyltransferase [Nonomuraea zeae]
MRELRLRPLMASDYAYVFGLLVGGANGARWRFRGATPSPEMFERALWSGVSAQLVAETRDRRPIGLAVAFNAVFEAGHVELGVAVDPGYQKRGGWTAAIGLGLLRHTFLSWPVHKVYGRIPAFNLADLRGLTRLGWVEEGTMRDYCFYDGHYWDEHVLALTREAWEKIDRRFARFCPEFGDGR